MAHWAQIDDNNIVTWVTVGNNDDHDEGYQWLVDNIGGTWLKCSYNTRGGNHLEGGEPLRHNFPSVGDIYDPERDVFIKQKPQDGLNYEFNETTLMWDYVRTE